MRMLLTSLAPLLIILQTAAPSPIPDPPAINMQMVSSILAEKDAACNAKSLNLEQAKATIEQLEKVILQKQKQIDELTRAAGTTAPKKP